MWPVDAGTLAFWLGFAVAVATGTTIWLLRYRRHPTFGSVCASAIAAVPGAMAAVERSVQYMLDRPTTGGAFAAMSCLWMVVGPIALVVAAAKLIASASQMASVDDFPVSIMPVYVGHVGLWLLSTFLCMPAD